MTKGFPSAFTFITFSLNWVGINFQTYPLNVLNLVVGLDNPTIRNSCYPRSRKATHGNISAENYNGVLGICVESAEKNLKYKVCDKLNFSESQVEFIQNNYVLKHRCIIISTIKRWYSGQDKSTAFEKVG